jgi:hypothetical protein
MQDAGDAKRLGRLTIEWRNGPMIKATHPEQIEVLAPASRQG